MITREDVLRRWFGQWSRLKAWRKDLSGVDLLISDEFKHSMLGTCNVLAQRVTIYRCNQVSFNAASELDTLLHELAHAACTIDHHHGVTWQRVYSEAVREVTGIAIPRAAANYMTLCRSGKAAVASWWRSSGNDALVRLAMKGA